MIMIWVNIHVAMSEPQKKVKSIMGHVKNYCHIKEVTFPYQKKVRSLIPRTSRILGQLASHLIPQKETL